MKNKSSLEKNFGNVTRLPEAVNLSIPPAGGRRHLVKAAGVVGFMTLVSRVSGMLRDIVNAKAFGTSWQWDAFLYAFMIPNFFRRIVGEGALATAFIPVYAETLQKSGKEQAFRFANVVFTMWMVILLALVLAAELLLHFFVRAEFLSPRVLLTLDLLRFLFPYLLLISLYSVAAGVLNAHRHFFIPSVTPVLLNIAWIAGVLWLCPLGGGEMSVQLRILGLTLVGAGFLQFAVQLPDLNRLGFRIRWVWDFFHEGLRKSARLLLPAILTFAVVQINLLVDMCLAFFIGPGANSSLWYGTRLMQLPLGVIAIAMNTALLPAVSHQAASSDMQAAKKTLSFALRSVFFLILPCSVGLMALSTPIVQLLFERGAFDAVSTARTSAVLFWYSLGLFAYSGQKLISVGFYGMQDSRTPMRLSVVGMVSNIVFNLLLIGPLAEAGLALATSLSGILQFVLLLFAFHRKVAGFPLKDLTLSFLKIALASAGMALFCRTGYQFWLNLSPSSETTAVAIRVFGMMFLSTAVYLLLCVLFRVGEVREAWQGLMRKKGGASDAR